MKNYLLTLSLVASLLIGCATWQDSAGKTLATTAQTVDSAMKGWALYAVRVNPPVTEQIKVRSAYGQYTNSFDVALKAYNLAVLTTNQNVWQASSSVLTASQTALLSLLASLTNH